MCKPNEQQRALAIAGHVEAVGKANVCAYEVALTLDGRHPGMSDREFVELQADLEPRIEVLRAEGLREIWG
ncbi:hypothetical protein [Acidovorax carolinensis]|nr:hypothetical protein [Acidovorax carolinensis]